jgi:putative hydrolase of the HAD superfamily
MIKAVLFDLDDTLYLESEFFRSGFRAVADELCRRQKQDPEQIVAMLERFHHNESRTGVFQKLAHRLKFPEDWIPGLVETFRNHEPSISPCADAVRCLQCLRGRFKTGCVTDGWKEVQRRKLKALNITQYFDVLIVCDDHGREHWKPHAFAFQWCCNALQLKPDQVVFVGDNPDRDIAGAKRAGLRCVQIRRKQGYSWNASCAEQADATIENLDELSAILETL